jgi:hypothetical protein
MTISLNDKYRRWYRLCNTTYQLKNIKRKVFNCSSNTFYYCIFILYHMFKAAIQVPIKISTLPSLQKPNFIGTATLNYARNKQIFDTLIRQEDIHSRILIFILFKSNFVH